MDELNDQTQIIEGRCPDRREWKRLLATSEYRVGLSVEAGDSRPAMVKDASIAGIALIVRDSSRLAVGDRAEIEIAGRKVTATIKNIVPAAGGEGFRIGLYWSEPKIDSILTLMCRTQEESAEQYKLRLG